MNKKQNDCYFFYYSTCTKDNCEYRHCVEALSSTTVCKYWLKRKECSRLNCPFRHMDSKRDRKSMPCYYENQETGCMKLHCSYLHRKPRINFVEAIEKNNTRIILPVKNVLEENLLSQGGGDSSNRRWSRRNSAGSSRLSETSFDYEVSSNSENDDIEGKTHDDDNDEHRLQFGDFQPILEVIDNAEQLMEKNDNGCESQLTTRNKKRENGTREKNNPHKSSTSHKNTSVRNNTVEDTVVKQLPKVNIKKGTSKKANKKKNPDASFPLQPYYLGEPVFMDRASTSHGRGMRATYSPRNAVSCGNIPRAVYQPLTRNNSYLNISQPPVQTVYVPVPVPPIHAQGYNMQNEPSQKKTEKKAKGKKKGKKGCSKAG